MGLFCQSQLLVVKAQRDKMPGVDFGNTENFNSVKNFSKISVTWIKRKWRTFLYCG